MLILNGPVLAEDRDIGVNAVVRYRLLGARVDLFSIDSLTGQKLSTDVMGYVHFVFLEGVQRLFKALTFNSL